MQRCRSLLCFFLNNSGGLWLRGIRYIICNTCWFWSFHETEYYILHNILWSVSWVKFHSCGLDHIQYVRYDITALFIFIKSIIELPSVLQYLLTIQITFCVEQQATVINFFLVANSKKNLKHTNYQITIKMQEFVLMTQVERRCTGNGSFSQVNRARVQMIFPSSLYRNTCLTVMSEGGKVDFSNYLCCCALVLSVHPSLTRIEVCNLFPGCVIQCGAALCSPEEHKQLPAPLIHTGALNSFYAQHPARILRREIMCMYSPAAWLISLADLLCIRAASSHIVLLLSDDIR